LRQRLREFGDALFQRLLLAAVGGDHLLLGGERDLALGERGGGGIALRAE
jgi:hypothetical protein